MDRKQEGQIDQEVQVQDDFLKHLLNDSKSLCRPKGVRILIKNQMSVYFLSHVQTPSCYIWYVLMTNSIKNTLKIIQ